MKVKKRRPFGKWRRQEIVVRSVYDPELKDNILGRNGTRLALWEEHLKDPVVALDKALQCVENSYQG